MTKNPKSTIKSPDDGVLAIIIKSAGSLALVALGVVTGLLGLAVIVQIFQMSFIVAFVLFILVGAIIWLPLAGAFVAFSGLQLWSAYEDVENVYEYYAKLIASYIGVAVLSYVAHIAGGFIAVLIAAFLTGMTS